MLDAMMTFSRRRPFSNFHVTFIVWLLATARSSLRTPTVAAFTTNNPPCVSRTSAQPSSRQGVLFSSPSSSSDLSAAQEALARTKAHLKKLKERQPTFLEDDFDDDEDNADLHPQQRQSIAQEIRYREYIIQSANSLKQELQRRKLTTKGRKPDLARRLAQHDIARATGVMPTNDKEEIPIVEKVSLKSNDKNAAAEDDDDDDESFPYPVAFAGLSLSETAAQALHQAGFLDSPSPIQAAAIPALTKGESVVMHAPTGSGKSLCYLLPITEYLWANHYNNNDDDYDDDDDDDNNFAVSVKEKFALILTPTRELAAQVAGVATTLAPPGSVRLIAHPTNIMSDGAKERSDRFAPTRGRPTLIVGSAKAILHSLFGNTELYPVSPTPKPLATAFLKNVRVLVMDEIDRLLNVAGTYNNNNNNIGNSPQAQHKHEKPAAILAAAVARHTLGKAQIVAASATVGRPLKRELARVLGLPPPKGPRVIVTSEAIADSSPNEKPKRTTQNEQSPLTTRLVTIPDTVEHYITTVAPNPDDENSNNPTSSSSISSGQLLIRAYQVIQNVVKAATTGSDDKSGSGAGGVRILLVLTRGFGISTQHVVGALQHFQCRPKPQSLLDALQENVEGTDQLMLLHRRVSGATGVGQSAAGTASTAADDDEDQQQSSLWVTGEDTIRGLHLDGLDVVIVVGRPRGPDEYTHIAGRTGRAGKSGKVITVVSQEEARKLTAWESMLQIQWQTYQNDNEDDDVSM